MAVSSTDVKTARLACNGSVTTFDFAFKIFEDTDIKVYLIKTSDDTRTLLTITTEYSVSAVNDDFSEGGTVTTVETYASGYEIFIIREVEDTQESDYTHGDDLPAETLENDLDRRAMASQEKAERLSRALVLPPEDPITLDPELPPMAERLGKYIYLDATYGLPVMVDAVAPSDAPVTDFMKTVLDDETASAALATLGLTVSTFIKTLLDDADAVIARRTLTSIKVVTDDSYTVLDNDGYTDILFDLVATNQGLTLPTAADNTGRDLYIKIRSNTSAVLTIDGEGAELINGIATWQLRGAGDWIHLICDGTGWHTKGHYESELETKVTNEVVQTTPTQNTWYAVTGFTLALPTGGVWEIEFKGHGYGHDETLSDINFTVADGSAEEDDSIYTVGAFNSYSKSGETVQFFLQFRRTFVSNVTLYVNMRTTKADVTSIRAHNEISDGYLRARRVA